MESVIGLFPWILIPVPYLVLAVYFIRRRIRGPKFHWHLVLIWVIIVTFFVALIACCSGGIASGP